jgi:putative membrane protein
MSRGTMWIALCALVGLVIILVGLAPAQEQNTNAGHTNTEQANTNTNSNTSRTSRHSNTNANMNANMSGDMGGNMNMQGNMNMAGGLVASDRKFVMAAGMGGMMEVELGRTATMHAASDEVKQFGQRMVDDHTKANNDLMQVATQKGITLPTALDPKEQAEMTKLMSLSGAEFDRAYMKLMLKDHQKDVKEFQSEANKGHDADVKGFAATALPTLQAHLRMAEDINAHMSGHNENANSRMHGNMNANGNANSNMR